MHTNIPIERFVNDYLKEVSKLQRGLYKGQEREIKDMVNLCYQQMIDEIPSQHSINMYWLIHEGTIITNEEKHKYTRQWYHQAWQGIKNLHIRTFHYIKRLVS